MRERRPPFSPYSVVEEFATLLRRYGVSEVTGDRYGGEWPREAFRSYGITYKPSKKPKSDLYKESLPAINAAPNGTRPDAQGWYQGRGQS